MHSTNPVIALSSVSLRAVGSEREAVREFSLDVEKGEVVVLQANAIACRLLIRLLVSGESGGSGIVSVNGVDPRMLRASERLRYLKSIGFVSESTPLMADRSVRANVALPLELDGELTGAARHRLDTLLRMVRLSDRALVAPDELSLGERQRCQLARALVREPLVLLLDNPTVALSDEHVQDIASIIEAERLRGMTILIASSDSRLERRLPNCRTVAVPDPDLVAVAL